MLKEPAHGEGSNRRYGLRAEGGQPEREPLQLLVVRILRVQEVPDWKLSSTPGRKDD